MQKIISVLGKSLALCFGLVLSSLAATAPTSKSGATIPQGKESTPLNQKDIHTAYNEGDFDKVVTLIESFTKSNKTYSRADSIFVAKHLAVVYSANPQTREKGKYFMYRLLEMMPSAELVDMFVSDEIDRIFDKVRREFLTRQKGFGVDSSQISMPENRGNATTPAATTQSAATQSTPAKTTSTPAGDSNPIWKRNAFWIASGAGVAVAGAAALFIYYQDDPVPGKSISIPSKTTASK